MLLEVNLAFFYYLVLKYLSNLDYFSYYVQFDFYSFIYRDFYYFLLLKQISFNLIILFTNNYFNFNFNLKVVAFLIDELLIELFNYHFYLFVFDS
jgi:hypothetical protein